MMPLGLGTEARACEVKAFMVLRVPEAAPVTIKRMPCSSYVIHFIENSGYERGLPHSSAKPLVSDKGENKGVNDDRVRLAEVYRKAAAKPWQRWISNDGASCDQ